jgi:hypothetical protein
MKNLLLPYYFKLIGIFLLVSGIVMAIFYIWFDFRFTMPVFAVYSVFFETKIFETFRTNFADELTLLFLICGLGMIVFSRQKTESAGLDLTRFKALSLAVIANTVFLLLSVIFVYGSGFMGILVINGISLFVFYLIIFFFIKRKKSVEKSE